MDKGIKSALFFLASMYLIGFGTVPLAMLWFGTDPSDINIFRFMLFHSIPSFIIAIYYEYRFFRCGYNGWYNLSTCYILCFMIALWAEYLSPHHDPKTLMTIVFLVFSFIMITSGIHFSYRTIMTKMEHQKEAG